MTDPDPDVAAPDPADPVEVDPPVAAADDLGSPGQPLDLSELNVESLLDDVERLARERDEFLELLRRTQADFENYKKQMVKRAADQVEHAATGLVEELLPVLDACDGAVQHGAVEVEPIFAALLGTLEKNGLERIDPVGQEFDPNRHEAVVHEPADDDSDAIVVADVMRRGYAWKGRVLRPAMVKVRG